MKLKFRLFLWLPCITAVIACVSMTLHSLHLTRQMDVQHIGYAFEFLQSLLQKDPASYLLYPHKYPLLSVLPLSVLYAGIIGFLFSIGQIPSLSVPDVQSYVFLRPTEIYLATRLTTVAFSILLLVLLYRTSRKLFPSTNPLYAVLLMLSSMLYLTFATSMRHHVPATCLIFLTFVLSLSLAEKASTLRLVLALGSATLAFCVLQNGLFAYIFPVLAYIYDDGEWRVRRWLHPRFLLILGSFLFLATLFGYPFLYRDLFVRHKLGFGLGNEDIGESPWGLRGFSVLFRTLLGSEIFLLIFTLITLWNIFRGRSALPSYLWSIALFTLVYSVFFGFVGWTTPRYFFPLSPFLALLGGVSLARSRWFIPLFVLLLMAVHFQFAFLGWKPDTYDLARAFLVENTTGAIAKNVPHYFLDIPPRRESIRVPSMEKERFILTLSADLPQARAFSLLSASSEAQTAVNAMFPYDPPPGKWTLCQHIESSKSPDRMFLWSEVDWAYAWIFRTSNLGPTLSIYCRS